MTASSALPPLLIKGMRIPLPIVQGGMGVGVSLAPLAGAVARAGGLGLLSSACLDRLAAARLGRKADTYEAVALEVAAAKAGGGYAGINIMVALQRDYEAAVRAALAAGADAIVSGAGLPLSLPEIAAPGATALIPIVSSARALALICRRW
ncbi:MAG: nitronate monooxygenase, partial [Actinobacteria bacterium]|nr:nitronate monooxygenase [Actinomycetota bacterium]